MNNGCEFQGKIKCRKNVGLESKVSVLNLDKWCSYFCHLHVITEYSPVEASFVCEYFQVNIFLSNECRNKIAVTYKVVTCEVDRTVKFFFNYKLGF